MNSNSSLLGPFEDPECRLYLVTPSEFNLREFQASLNDAMNAGDVACVQLRMKDASDDLILGAAEMLMPIVHDHGAAFLINDRPDIAARAGADGVHIGQKDASYEEARSLLGDAAIIGITCHNSRHLAMIAGEKDADYVAFGAMYPSTTKQAKTEASLDLIRWWHEVTVVQCVAIGGLTPENCSPVVEAGADFLAVCAAVWSHTGGPAMAVQAFNAAIQQAKQNRAMQ